MTPEPMNDQEPINCEQGGEHDWSTRNSGGRSQCIHCGVDELALAAQRAASPVPAPSVQEAKEQHDDAVRNLVTSVRGKCSERDEDELWVRLDKDTRKLITAVTQEAQQASQAEIRKLTQDRDAQFTHNTALFESSEELRRDNNWLNEQIARWQGLLDKSHTTGSINWTQMEALIQKAIAAESSLASAQDALDALKQG